MLYVCKKNLIKNICLGTLILNIIYILIFDNWLYNEYIIFLATLLLNSLVDHLTKNPEGNSCKAVYLHVLTTNTTAIQFYERRNFSLHSYLPLYYSVHDVAKDGYSYVLYINGGHPPWTILYPFVLCIFVTITYILLSKKSSSQ